MLRSITQISFPSSVTSRYSSSVIRPSSSCDTISWLTLSLSAGNMISR